MKKEVEKQNALLLPDISNHWHETVGIYFIISSCFNLTG